MMLSIRQTWIRSSPREVLSHFCLSQAESLISCFYFVAMTERSVLMRLTQVSPREMAPMSTARYGRMGLGTFALLIPTRGFFQQSLIFVVGKTLIMQESQTIAEILTGGRLPPARQ